MNAQLSPREREVLGSVAGCQLVSFGQLVISLDRIPADEILATLTALTERTLVEVRRGCRNGSLLVNATDAGRQELGR